MQRKYLGDGLYMEFDGYQIWLITSDGISDTNKVALDSETLETFITEVKRLKGVTQL